MFELGAKAHDKISKFAGVLTGRVEYLTDKTRYQITGECVGGQTSANLEEWFDESRIVVEE